MGGFNSSQFSPSFNGAIRVEERPERLTCHAGLLLLRELDERLGVTSDLAARLVDERAASRIQHPLRQMLRTTTYAMAIDSAHASAAAARANDAVFQIATSDSKGLSLLDDDGAMASQATLSRLFAQLSSEANLPILRAALFDSTAKAVHAAEGSKVAEVTLAIDSYPIPVHGHQAGSEHDGYYKTRCYHPLGVMLGETGHWLDLKLLPGNVGTADGANEMLAPLIDRARRDLSTNVRVRGDAGFIGAKTLAMLDAKEIPFVLWLPTNFNLAAYEEIHAVRPPATSASGATLSSTARSRGRNLAALYLLLSRHQASSSSGRSSSLRASEHVSCAGRGGGLRRRATRDRHAPSAAVSTRCRPNCCFRQKSDAHHHGRGVDCVATRL